MNAQEQAREWLKRNATFDDRVIHPKHEEFDLIASLLASLEEVQQELERLKK